MVCLSFSSLHIRDAVAFRMASVYLGEQIYISRLILKAAQRQLACVQRLVTQKYASIRLRFSS